LGLGVWPPHPNPQSPIPNPQLNKKNFNQILFIIKNLKTLKKRIFKKNY